MFGLMQDWPLTLDKIIDHAAANHGAREVVTRSLEGPVERTGYAEIRRRAKQVSNALLKLGIRPGDRVATLAWNTARHLEIWYGAMGIGAVCHTLNPRLHPDQLCWIINHAGDRVVFTDPTLAPMLLGKLAEAPSPVETVVVMTDLAHRPDGLPAEVATYEELIAEASETCAWGGFDERTAAGLCYTSGTTGDPKGVLYSHRSNFLHTLIVLQPDVVGLSVRDSVLMVVPMFHANAWGLAFAAPAVGAKLVMPGARLDPPALLELIEQEGVTFAAAVPTVWTSLLQHLDKVGGRLETLNRVVIGGSACPDGLIRAFHDRYGVEVLHAWGMTEISPMGTLGSMTPELAAQPFEAQMPARVKQGRAPLGVELKLTDDHGRPVAQDGRASGHLKVRGPAVAAAYFGEDGRAVLDPEGYFDTGDVATLDPAGYMQITDRAKDLIKSGGEWISSVAIETLALGHPAVACAAVIGRPDAKWSERPVLIVELKPGAAAGPDELLAWLDGRIARWWTPDEVLFLDRIPLGATGKVDKKRLRAQFAVQTPSQDGAEPCS